jgi:hypothetical protein
MKHGNTYSVGTSGNFCWFLCHILKFSAVPSTALLGVFGFGSFGLTCKPNWFCSASHVARGADIVAGVTLVMPL